MNASEWSSYGIDTINSAEHRNISYEAALQSLVLLRNDGDALPLKIGSKVAVVGPQSTARSGLLSDYAGGQWCYGQSNKHPWSSQEYCIPSIAEGIAAANTGGVTNVAAGVSTCTTNQVSPKCKQSVSEWNSSTAAGGIASALQIARVADAVVLVLGIDKSVEREGRDRIDTALPESQETFAHQVLTLNKPTVLVLTNGGALAIDSLANPRAGQAGAAPFAILEAFNPAAFGGRAIGESLFGKANRFGKLPITMYPHDYIQQQPLTNYDMSKPPGRT